MSYLAECKPIEAQKVMRVLQEVKELKQTHRFHRQGYSNDRAKTLRMTAKFPMSMMFHPEYKKYFDPAQDPHERKKNMIKLMRLFPEFVVVDKL